MKLFEILRRLLSPRARPAAARPEEPSADRPPPPRTSSPETASAPSTPDVIPAVDDAAQVADDAAEVRALLDAVAEPPVSALESEGVPPPAPEPVPAATPEPTPTALPRSGELILTLATPAATFTIARSATLGRGQENTIRLADLSVSRRHARIVYRQGGYWLSDLGSMGGTWVDGTRLSAPQRIAAGQVIDIGLCRLTVSFAGGAVVEGRRG